jgi:hypothetical protein
MHRAILPNFFAAEYLQKNALHFYDKITMAKYKLERKKWTWTLPRTLFLAAVVFAAFTSSLLLICGVAVSRELGNLPDDFLLSAQSKVHLGSTFLAYQQSYGFFDDIPDESWILMQQRALKSSHYGSPGLPEITDEKNPDEDYLSNLQVSGRFQESLCLIRHPLVRLTCFLAARLYLPSSQSCRPAGKRTQVDLRP